MSVDLAVCRKRVTALLRANVKNPDGSMIYSEAVADDRRHATEIADAVREGALRVLNTIAKAAKNGWRVDLMADSDEIGHREVIPKHIGPIGLVKIQRFPGDEFVVGHKLGMDAASPVLFDSAEIPHGGRVPYHFGQMGVVRIQRFPGDEFVLGEQLTTDAALPALFDSAEIPHRGRVPYHFGQTGSVRIQRFTGDEFVLGQPLGMDAAMPVMFDSAEIPHRGRIPFRFGPPGAVKIQAFAEQEFRAGAIRPATEIESMRLNPHELYSPVAHDQPDEDGLPSQIAGYWDIIAGELFYTGLSAVVQIAMPPANLIESIRENVEAFYGAVAHDEADGDGNASRISGFYQLIGEELFYTGLSAKVRVAMPPANLIESMRENVDDFYGTVAHDEADGDGNPSRISGFFQLIGEELFYTGLSAKVRVAMPPANLIESMRENVDDFYGAVAHNEADGDGNASRISGFWNEYGDELLYTGNSAKVQLANVADADAANKVPDPCEDVVVAVGFALSPKDGDVNLTNLAGHYMTYAEKQLAGIEAGSQMIEPLPAQAN